jgi:hypothetical protein
MVQRQDSTQTGGVAGEPLERRRRMRRRRKAKARGIDAYL